MSESDKDSKKEKLRAAVKERVDKEEHAFRLVEKMVLLDSVDKEFFLNAGTYITVSQYNDVTEERAITKLCGYPLCNNRITQVLKQKYKISIREKKVYDITERKNFCSNRCYKASKYFQSQLSAEAIWMREKTKSLELKLLDDAQELTAKLSGSGEEILMNRGRNDEKHVHADGEHEHHDCEHEHVRDEHEHVDNEDKHVDNEHEDHDDEHEYIDDEHEHIDDEHEHIDDEHEHTDDEHDNIHESVEHFHNSEDLSGVIGRIGNIQIDLGIDSTDSDDDSDKDDDDNDHCGDYENNIGDDKEKDTKKLESYFHDNLKSAKSMKKSLSNNQEKDANNDFSFPASQSENRTANLRKVDNPNVSANKRSHHSQTTSGPQYTDEPKLGIDKKSETTNSTKKGIYTSDFEKTLTNNDKEYRRSGVHDVTSDGHVVRANKELARKQCVDKVYQVLLEWCSIKTRECIRSFIQNKEFELLDEKENVIAEKETNKRRHNAKQSTVTLPSIDSKSQITIRGKIVSEKVTKAMSPMLSRLGLTIADISSQLTCILKTFRFTNTNIVLKPPEWTLVALILILVLVKYSPSLTGLLSSRQSDLHSLLSNIVDDEGDVDRLLGVFNFEDSSVTEPAVEDGQQHFDMEELD